MCLAFFFILNWLTLWHMIIIPWFCFLKDFMFTVIHSTAIDKGHEKENPDRQGFPIKIKGGSKL